MPPTSDFTIPLSPQPPGLRRSLPHTALHISPATTQRPAQNPLDAGFICRCRRLRVANRIGAARGSSGRHASRLHGGGARGPIWGFGCRGGAGFGSARGRSVLGRRGGRDPQAEERAGGPSGQVGRHAAAARSQVRLRLCLIVICQFD